MKQIVVALAIVFAGCGYSPAFRDCAITCAASIDCPDTFVCGGEGLCRVEGDRRSCAEVLQPDAMGAADDAVTGPAYVPSNGANDEHLVGVMASLDVGPSVNATIDTTTGEILLGATTRRAAGVGVISGIGFYPIDQTIAVLAVTAVKLETGSRVRVRGKRALILWSRGDVDIAGVIDVSAGCVDGKKSCPGPGGFAGSTTTATSTGCGAGFDGTLESGGLEGSGGGGGFGQPGGSYLAACTPEGEGGAACGSAALVPLTGGYGGGRGNARAGGGGGGGIQISSKTTIRITSGGIDAAGAGGTGVPFGDTSPAGGGGSGGAILLEALEVTLTSSATLAANGGAGGGSCEGAGAGELPDGEDGRFDTTSAQPGGCQNSIGGGSAKGGNGGSATSAAGNSLSCSGGGGGAVGRIRINTLPAGVDAQGVKYSPEPTFGFVTTL
jgi:hypothetical protein